MTGIPSSLPTSIGKLKIPSAMIQVTDCPVAVFNWPEHNISLNNGIVRGGATLVIAPPPSPSF